MWWILKENLNTDVTFPTTLIAEEKLILRMSHLDYFLGKSKEDIKKYFIEQGTTNVSAGILANLVFTFFASMHSGDYIVIPHKGTVKCVQIQNDSFEHHTEEWSWKINEIISLDREHISDEINKYIRTPRILIAVDDETIFHNFFITGAPTTRNSFDIPLDLENKHRKATITIPIDISPVEKERLKSLLSLYL